MTNQGEPFYTIVTECPSCGVTIEYPVTDWSDLIRTYEPCSDCQEVIEDYARMESDIVDEFESCSEGCQYLYGYCIC